MLPSAPSAYESQMRNSKGPENATGPVKKTILKTLCHLGSSILFKCSLIKKNIVLVSCQVMFCAANNKVFHRCTLWTLEQILPGVTHEAFCTCGLREFCDSFNEVTSWHQPGMSWHVRVHGHIPLTTLQCARWHSARTPTSEPCPRSSRCCGFLLVPHLAVNCHVFSPVRKYKKQLWVTCSLKKKKNQANPEPQAGRSSWNSSSTFLKLWLGGGRWQYYTVLFQRKWYLS